MFQEFIPVVHINLMLTIIYILYLYFYILCFSPLCSHRSVQCSVVAKVTAFLRSLHISSAFAATKNVRKQREHYTNATETKTRKGKDVSLK